MEIYLDINCISDFNKKYNEVYGCLPLEIDSNGNTLNDNYPQFVKDNHFISLEWTENGKQLFDYIKTINARVYILINTASSLYNMQIL